MPRSSEQESWFLKIALNNIETRLPPSSAILPISHSIFSKMLLREMAPFQSKHESKDVPMSFIDIQKNVGNSIVIKGQEKTHFQRRIKTFQVKEFLLMSKKS